MSRHGVPSTWPCRLPSRYAEDTSHIAGPTGELHTLVPNLAPATLGRPTTSIALHGPNRPRDVGRHNARRTPPRRGSYRVYLNAPTKTETHWDEARRGAHSQHHVSVVFGRPISDLDHIHIIKAILCLIFDI